MCVAKIANTSREGLGTANFASRHIINLLKKDALQHFTIPLINGSKRGLLSSI